MPAEVKILIEGYTNADSVGENVQDKGCSTVTLIRDDDLIIVVDPGVLKSQQILIDSLARESLTVGDVDVVIITHSHIEHYRNLGMFPNAKVLEYYGLWEKDTVTAWDEDFTSNIRIIHTPGHDYTGISVLVNAGPESEYPGVIAICGDVFWRENYPANEEDDAYSSHPDQLRESRRMILQLADWIVPGHSNIYKNEILVEDMPSRVEDVAPVFKGAQEKKLKIIVTCKKCRRQMEQKDKCRCRPYLCFKCCECGLDCDLCYCSHKIK